MSAEAVGTLAQSATRLTKDIVLYQVSYELGFKKYEVRAPIGAMRNLQVGSTSPYLGYTILNDSETLTDIGKSAGLVLSGATIDGADYIIPKGSAATFTLVTLLSLPEAIGEDLDLALQVTALPFTMIGDTVTIDGHLNASELQYFITPEVDVDIR